VIHLAAVQVPFCQADPATGAHINIVGTLNLLDAFVSAESLVGPFVYASSIAAYGPPQADGTPGGGLPQTIYGITKDAVEQLSHMFGEMSGVRTIGLRPHVVYGVGRDQGLTSSPTAAMVRAAAGLGSTITYSGRSQVQLASDVAHMFVRAARSNPETSAVFDLGGPVADMNDVVAAIEAAAPSISGEISVSGSALPFPAEVPSGALDELIGDPSWTSLSDGVAKTIERYRELLEDEIVQIPD